MTTTKRRRAQPHPPERVLNIHMQPGAHTPSHSACSSRKPSLDRAEIIARTIEVHLRNGNWAMARNTLDHAETEFAALARTPTEWLDAELFEFPLPHRAISILEAAGHITMRDVLTFLNTGAEIPFFGPQQAEEVWCAAHAKGIEFERSEIASLKASQERKRRLYLDRHRRRGAKAEKEKVSA